MSLEYLLLFVPNLPRALTASQPFFFFSFLNVPTVLLVDSSMRDTLDRSLVARPLPESPTLVYTCINGQCPRAPTVIRVINSLSSVGKSSTEKESLRVEADVARSCDRANY